MCDQEEVCIEAQAATRVRVRVLALLAVGAVSYRSMVESTESDLWMRHTHEVLENLQDLLGAMQAVESKARGYLLTGDESFLEIYRAGIAKTEQD